MMETGKTRKQQQDEWHNNPCYWKLGMFYYNKNDNRFFPPKKNYTGITINFAKPKAIIIFVLAVSIILTPIVILVLKTLK